jgi:DNA repair protein RecO (recombination protein O)
MNQIVTQAIVLGRTDYGEADRILSLLTPDHGKLRLMAKGVRRVKSKLAGGIELFSISNITFIRGRGEIGTLVSTRLVEHYGEIAKDIKRVQQGYDLIQLLNKTVEDEAEEVYFHLLHVAFAALNDLSLSAELIQIWFVARLLAETGHMPNLRSTVDGKPLSSDKEYDFDLDSMTFTERPGAQFGANQIKFMRLLFSDTSPKVLAAVEESDDYVQLVAPLMRVMSADYLHH